MLALKNKLGKISWIWLIIAIFFTKELLWSYLTPPWQAPDEIAHFGYVESLFYEHEFPVLGKTLLSERVQAIGPVDPLKEINYYKASLNLNWIAQHPPLYYFILQPLYAFLPHDDVMTCILVLRLVSILMGCVTLWYAGKTLKILLPDNEIVQKTVVVGMAFLPVFSSISAVMNNDNLVFMLASMLTYLSVKNFKEHDTQGSLQMGVLLGLLALTKATSLPLFLSIFLLEIIKHLRQKLEKKNNPHCFLKDQLAIFGMALLLGGWWYIRNIALYGTFLPNIGSLAIAQPSLIQLFPDLPKTFPEASGVIALPNAGWWDFFVKEGFLYQYYKNIWGAFGQFFFRLFTWQYFVIGGLTVASLCGYFKVIIKSVRVTHYKIDWKKILTWKGWTMWLPFLAVAGGIIYELFKIYRERGFLSAMQGRYLFSALIAFMYLLVRGLEHVTPRKHLAPLLILVMTFFVVNDFTSLIYRIIPEFY